MRNYMEENGFELINSKVGYRTYQHTITGVIVDIDYFYKEVRTYANEFGNNTLTLEQINAISNEIDYRANAMGDDAITRISSEEELENWIMANDFEDKQYITYPKGYEKMRRELEDRNSQSIQYAISIFNKDTRKQSCYSPSLFKDGVIQLGHLIIHWNDVKAYQYYEHLFLINKKSKKVSIVFLKNNPPMDKYDCFSDEDLIRTAKEAREEEERE